LGHGHCCGSGRRFYATWNGNQFAPVPGAGSGQILLAERGFSFHNIAEKDGTGIDFRRVPSPRKALFDAILASMPRPRSGEVGFIDVGVLNPTQRGRFLSSAITAYHESHLP
jgi:hypothetical protein